jgi:CRP-like cAMP-binding protein/small-conductance mechanosensitive channel
MRLLFLVGMLGVVIVVAAMLLRLTPASPGSRLRLKRSVLLYIGFLLLSGVQAVAVGAMPATLQAICETASDLILILLSINLVALAVFDFGLRLMRFRYPEIVHDVLVGIAYGVAVVWLMHRTGVNLASIVATSAVVTAVIGLSLQSTLGSVIGGLALQVDDSLSVGDCIELENKEQGHVRRVRWRHTLVETRDGNTLVIPNNQLLNQTIKIIGKQEGAPLQSRIRVSFNVDFRFAPSDVTTAVTDALRSAPIPGVSAVPAPNAICEDLGGTHRDSFAHYVVRYWLTDLENPDIVSSLVRERVFVALKRAQIPLAMPAAAHFISLDDQSRVQRKREQELARTAQSLSRVEIFGALSPEELEHLAASVKVSPFSRGEVITRQGAQAHWLYVLTSGEVEVRVENAGEERRVTSFSAPSFFGEMALMTGAPREATVVALSDAECVRVDKADFRDLLQRRPEIAEHVAAVLAERRVALIATREGLGAEAKSRRVEGERTRILSTVQAFFGLKD